MNGAALREGLDAADLRSLNTPSLLLDRDRLRRNLSRMADHIGARHGTLRPHIKTHKCIEVLAETRRAGPIGGITVSTLAEAEAFFAAGERDILYGVGITPDKLPRVIALLRAGCRLTIVLDSVETARAVVAAGEAAGIALPVLIELDVDGHRSGVGPDSPDLLAIADCLRTGTGATVEGVMTHAGESYGAADQAAIDAAARQERDLSLHAARRLRAAGHDCPVVSIGSTPTALAFDDLSGITEVRAGVYALFDLFQMGLGQCSTDDVALSVLATVIGHQRARNWILVDAGWMALSRDRGTQSQAVDQGYGIVCDLSGTPIEDLIVVSANQEHGIVARRSGGPPPALPIGERVRILPNHACATAAQHQAYQVSSQGDIVARWNRISGW